LRDAKHDGEPKQHPAARAIAYRLGARNKRDDGVVETEDADLAQNVSGRPGDENMPSAAGPSSRATRNVKMPRKFEASIAIVLRNAPRFNSTPVSSTRAGASVAGGGIPGGFSVVFAKSGDNFVPIGKPSKPR